MTVELEIILNDCSWSIRQSRHLQTNVKITSLCKNILDNFYNWQHWLHSFKYLSYAYILPLDFNFINKNMFPNLNTSAPPPPLLTSRWIGSLGGPCSGWPFHARLSRRRRLLLPHPIGRGILHSRDHRQALLPPPCCHKNAKSNH